MIALMTLAVSASAPAESIEGLWLHPERSVIIHLSPCGNALCGTVTWANENAKKAARRGIDPLVGARLLTDLRPRSNGQWRGKLFVPDLNVRVNGKITPINPNKLRVSGCLIGGMICGSQVWTRTDQPVAR
ncbi:hypothetical protein GCM10023264_17720 [Sphingomonas daechungensis]|uniref:DUF2147 domain-containing protein n=1 Tax=Sphingomonas daechungensis TaxID=1176646 RepID=A0ABX6T484_9SPHN|nr:DUF2147 domain-containing protein [Sphingomonas daechungensis]QNP44038.1 DUF2147 domain-containing protein [Sphingomonas daechungensis]